MTTLRSSLPCATLGLVGILGSWLLLPQAAFAWGEYGRPLHKRPESWKRTAPISSSPPAIEPLYLRYMRPFEPEPEPTKVVVPTDNSTETTQPHEKATRLAEGRNSEVFRLCTPHSEFPEYRILKVYNSAVWGQEHKLHVRSSEQIQAAGIKEVEAVEALRARSQRMKDLIPSTVAAGLPGWLLKKEARSGRSYGRIWWTGDQEVAKKQIDEVLAEARDILGPGAQINTDPDNFIFSEYGKPELKAWLSVTPVPEGNPVMVNVGGRLETVRLKENIGSGANSRVFSVEVDGLPSFSVLKVLKQYAPSRHPRVGTDAVRRALVEEAVSTAEKLRNSPAVRIGDNTLDFKAIIPQAIGLAPGVLLQERGKGVPYEKLWDWKARDRAHDELDAIVSTAEKILPDHVLSDKPQNFLFDEKTGGVTSWYDHLSDGPKAYRSSKKARPFKQFMTPAELGTYESEYDARHEF